jgi:hypothetical protein
VNRLNTVYSERGMGPRQLDHPDIGLFFDLLASAGS